MGQMNAAPTGFGALLRVCRERRGLSINVLGRRAGCDPSYISRLECSQRRPPSGVMLRRLCIALAPDADAQRRLVLAATGIPEAWDWQQAEIHLAVRRAAEALVAACPCTACAAHPATEAPP